MENIFIGRKYFKQDTKEELEVIDIQNGTIYLKNNSGGIFVINKKEMSNYFSN